MTFEFSSKIQTLTNKLNGLQGVRKETDIDDVKDQLRKMNDALKKELLLAERRISKVENRLARREDSSRRSNKAIETVWNDREEKVSEIIGGWVQQYQEKAEQARALLVREELNYQIRLQEEQEVTAKEIRMQENRTKDLLHILDRQMAKLTAINSQNQAALEKEAASALQTLGDDIAKTDQLCEEKARELECRMATMKEGIKSRCTLLSQEIGSKSGKLKHVMKLLLDME